jgi:hypothetical protein
LSEVDILPSNHTIPKILFINTSKYADRNDSWRLTFLKLEGGGVKEMGGSAGDDA